MFMVSASPLNLGQKISISMTVMLLRNYEGKTLICMHAMDIRGPKMAFVKIDFHNFQFSCSLKMPNLGIETEFVAFFVHFCALCA